jgi:hypothetical protein
MPNDIIEKWGRQNEQRHDKKRGLNGSDRKDDRRRRKPDDNKSNKSLQTIRAEEAHKKHHSFNGQQQPIKGPKQKGESPKNIDIELEQQKLDAEEKDLKKQLKEIEVAKEKDLQKKLQKEMEKLEAEEKKLQKELEENKKHIKFKQNLVQLMGNEIKIPDEFRKELGQFLSPAFFTNTPQERYNELKSNKDMEFIKFLEGFQKNDIAGTFITKSLGSFDLIERLKKYPLGKILQRQHLVDNKKNTQHTQLHEFFYQRKLDNIRGTERAPSPQQSPAALRVQAVHDGGSNAAHPNPRRDYRQHDHHHRVQQNLGNNYDLFGNIYDRIGVHVDADHRSPEANMIILRRFAAGLRQMLQAGPEHKQQHVRRKGPERKGPALQAQVDMTQVLDLRIQGITSMLEDFRCPIRQTLIQGKAAKVHMIVQRDNKEHIVVQYFDDKAIRDWVNKKQTNPVTGLSLQASDILEGTDDYRNEVLATIKTAMMNELKKAGKVPNDDDPSRQEKLDQIAKDIDNQLKQIAQEWGWSKGKPKNEDKPQGGAVGEQAGAVTPSSPPSRRGR